MIALLLAAASLIFGRRISRRMPTIPLPSIPLTARFASLLFSGLFAGFLVGVLVLELAMRRFDANVYTQVRHVELVGLDTLAAATLLPALATTAFLLIADRRNRRTARLTLTALILLALALTISFLVNVPINGEQLTWVVQTPPAHWASTRDRWQLSHILRTAAAVLAFGCLCAAALVNDTDPPPAPGTIIESPKSQQSASSASG